MYEYYKYKEKTFQTLDNKTVCGGFTFTSDVSKAYSYKRIEESCKLILENGKGINYQKIHKIRVCPEKPTFNRVRSRPPFDVSSHSSFLQDPVARSLTIDTYATDDIEPRSNQPISRQNTSKSSAIVSSSSIFFSLLQNLVNHNLRLKLNLKSQLKKFLPVKSNLVNLLSSSNQIRMPPMNTALIS
nr:uncharacterized protein LOC124814155 [Hydra vulgaris]